jgi:hypothetical protein
MRGTRITALRVAGAALVALGCLTAALVDAQVGANAGPRWWKGNLHTHSLWSDGDDYPEMIAGWYKDQGYHFLALSDHNILSQGDRWIEATAARAGGRVLAGYKARFGEAWVEERAQEGKQFVRLKPLDEFAPLLEEPGRFLMIPGEEITDSHNRRPVHMNATNLREFIKPRGGDSVYEVMQNNTDAVLEQRERTGQPMFPHLNHPNFGYAITGEDLARVKGERFFEVYNGHPTVYNTGDGRRVGTERMWDIILTLRLSPGGTGETMFGLATDDSHHYHQFEARRSNPGRGWVMVRATHLTPGSIVRAMEAGDFYGSSGVQLREVRREGRTLTVTVEPEVGVDYTIRFIGTRKGYDPVANPVLDAEGKPLVTTRRYSDDIGRVFAETRGPTAAYTLRPEDLYVRAVVTSTRPHPRPNPEGGFETAWVQPLLP